MCRVPLLRECGMQILRQHGAGTIIVLVSLTFTIHTLGFAFNSDKVINIFYELHDSSR